MPAMMVISEPFSSSPSTGRYFHSGVTSAATVSGHNASTARRVRGMNQSALNFDTYLLSASPPGFELPVANYTSDGWLTAYADTDDDERPFGRAFTSGVERSVRCRLFQKSIGHKLVSSCPQQPPQQQRQNEKNAFNCLNIDRPESSALDQNSTTCTCSCSRECSVHGGRTKSSINGKKSGVAKKVSFADDVGKLLAEIRVFFKFNDIPPVIRQNLTKQSNRSRYSLEMASIEFAMPCDDRLALMDSVARNNVSLETVYVSDVTSPTSANYLLSGIVLVKNVAFEKSVFVRHSLDGWRTSGDSPAEYVRSEIVNLCDDGDVNNVVSEDRKCRRRRLMLNVDSFSFTVSLPHVEFQPQPSTSENQFRTVELAVCYELPHLHGATGQSFWDNNGGKNYKIQLKVTEVAGEDTRHVSPAPILTEPSVIIPTTDCAPKQTVNGSVVGDSTARAKRRSLQTEHPMWDTAQAAVPYW